MDAQYKRHSQNMETPTSGMQRSRTFDQMHGWITTENFPTRVLVPADGIGQKRDSQALKLEERRMTATTLSDLSSSLVTIMTVHYH